MSVLVTGGAGYIGSHTCVELMNEGRKAVIVDSLVNSSAEAVRRVGELTGQEPVFYAGDIRDGEILEKIFSEQDIDTVIHFAGLKAVGESVEKPLEYFDNNITGTLKLLSAMRAHEVKRIIFSSSATVYGDPEEVPIREDAALSVTNPYGRTKLMIEQMLGDIAAADPSARIILLRYFNPVGAHSSGRIGEDPRGIPNNLTPYITQVAIGKLPYLRVFGNDYDTPDGTGVRDYIHVVDLARGHTAAMRRLDEMEAPIEVYNLGTGRGYSVLEVLHAFEKAVGREIPYQICGRRPGDIAVCYAGTDLAEEKLHWKAERGIEEMCADSWRWQSMNPEGYHEG